MGHGRPALTTPHSDRRPDGDRGERRVNDLGAGWRVALAAPPALAVALFTVWPLATLLVAVTHGSTLGRVWHLPRLGATLWFTTWQAALSTVVTMVIGIVPAYLVNRLHFRGRAAVRALVVVPFFLPTVVVAAAFLAVLPESWHGTPWAMIAAHAFLNVAVVVQVVGAMWAVIPTDLTGAARTLGAGPGRVAWHVLIPLLRPALASAATVVFLFSFTSFGAAKLLGGPAHPTLEVEIVRRATQLGDVAGAAVLSVLQLVALAATIAASAAVQRRTRVALRGDARPRPRRWRDPQPWIAAATGAAFAVPLVVLAGRSVHGASGWTGAGWTRWQDTGRRAGLGTPVDVGAALATSLRAAALAAALSVTLATLAALSIHLARRFGWLLDVGLALPLATSAVTIGLGMLITFDVAPVDWRATWWLIPVGHAMVATPFAVRALLGVLRSTPADLRAAAATLGATPRRALWEVEGRALRRPLVALAGLTATISLGEFGATTVLSRSGTETLPLAIGRLLGRAGDLPRLQAYALATVLGAVCATIVAVSGWASRPAPEGR